MNTQQIEQNTSVHKKILIVEDELVLRQMLVRRAEKQFGYECLSDQTGEKCIEMCREFDPDLVLLDMGLPKVSGLGLLRMIKSDPSIKHIPVIVYSAYGDFEIMEEAFALGASDYYTKSESLSELFTRIESQLNKNPQTSTPLSS